MLKIIILPTSFLVHAHQTNSKLLFGTLTETEVPKRAPPPPPPERDMEKSDPGSKSEGEDEPPVPPHKRGLGRTPNHLTLRYQHMYGFTSQHNLPYTQNPIGCDTDQYKATLL